MHGIRLLIKNAFKSSIRNIYQIIGLSSLILLVSLIISLLISTANAVVISNGRLNETSNLRDDLIQISGNSRINYDSKNNPTPEQTEIFGKLNGETSQEIFQEALVNYLSKEMSFDWTRTEGRTFSDLKIDSQSLLIKTLIKFGNKTQELSADNLIDTNSVDKLNVFSGNYFSSDWKQAKHQVILQGSFAIRNNIKIGDIIRLQKDSYSEFYGDQLNVNSDSKINNSLAQSLNGRHWYEAFASTEYANASWFEVIGYGESADFAMPIIDATTPLPNIKKDLLAYLAPNVFGFDSQNSETKELLSYNPRNAILTLTSDSDREVYYSLKAQNKSSNFIEVLQNRYKEIAQIFTDTNFVFANGDSKYSFNNRVTMFHTVTLAYNVVSYVLLLIVVAISVATIILMTQKYVESVQKQIGCLKALGYKKREVVSNFIAIPLVTSGIGCILGYSISLGIGQLVLFGFQGYFNIHFGSISFNIWSFVSSILFTFLIMTIIAFSTAYFNIRHSPLVLLKGSYQNDSASSFALKIKKILPHKGFNAKLQAALISSSFGKLLGMTVTIFLATVLMSATIIAPKMMSDNIKQNFTGLDYKNAVEYTTPLWNNPLTFQRTYNPNYQVNNAANDGWGYLDADQKRKDSVAVIQKSELKGSSAYTVDAISALPYNSDPSSIEVFDVNKIVNAIMSGNLSSDFYSYDIPTNDAMGSSWSKLAYMGWKTLSIEFLRNLNSVLGGSLAIGTLAKQWPDYVDLLNNLSSETNEHSYFAILLAFYKNYSNGIPLFDYADTTTTVTADKIASDLGTYLPNKDWITDPYLQKISIETNENGIESNFTFHDRSDSEIDINKIDASTYIDTEDVKNITTQILRWFWGTTYKKIGTILLNTAYSRAPYFVQQKLKNAMLFNNQYSLSFNVSPYDQTIDDLGTMLNASYNLSNGSERSVKIYGIDENQKTVDFNGLSNNLFEKDLSNVIPIIINKTVQKQTSKKIGDSIDIDYYYNEIQKYDDTLNEWHSSQLTDDFTTINDLDTAIGFDNKNMVSTSYIPESAMDYYSINGNYTDALVSGVTNAKVGGSGISAAGSITSTNSLPIHDDVLNGKIKYTSINKNAVFKIVGVQDSYGNPQAWISNDNANILTKYNETQKYDYKHLFVKQWQNILANATTYNLEDADGNPLFSSIVNLEGDYPDYDTLIEKSSTGNVDAQKILNLFNKTYPIYNYKNSLSAETYDIDQVISTNQMYGDYSAMGLNGGYNEVDDGSGGTVKQVYQEGFGQGAISLLYPITQARQILEQITDIVNMVIIMFLIIALIVSLTIIMLTTNIIIKENAQFIATMKILGYTDVYIVTQIIGMYLVGIIISFIIGFVVSWFTVLGMGNLLAMNSSWVLPVNYYWWYPFAVFGILLVIYTFTTSIGWVSIKKIKPIVALQFEK
ncbi:ABC transporter permease [Spiroplasma endosymbiont of Labia minor]|uniref:ABC transporter permease n=1 Tax=Spiroplasma endosymbiont of Labia minor TaxID=3066305 RepID=UPI0030D5FF60